MYSVLLALLNLDSDVHPANNRLQIITIKQNQMLTTDCELAGGENLKFHCWVDLSWAQLGMFKLRGVFKTQNGKLRKNKAL